MFYMILTVLHLLGLDYELWSANATWDVPGLWSSGVDLG